jgi:hypothetical protein
VIECCCLITRVNLFGPQRMRPSCRRRFGRGISRAVVSRQAHQVSGRVTMGPVRARGGGTRGRAWKARQCELSCVCVFKRCFRLTGNNELSSRAQPRTWGGAPLVSVRIDFLLASIFSSGCAVQRCPKQLLIMFAVCSSGPTIVSSSSLGGLMLRTAHRQHMADSRPPSHQQAG